MPKVFPPAPSYPARPTASPHRRNRILLLIALFKFLKAALVLGGGVLALAFRKVDLTSLMLAWVRQLRLDPDNLYVSWVLRHVALIHESQLRLLAWAAFFYALLFGIEGVGLLMEKAWAEYLVIVEIVALIPIEIYGIVHKPDLLRWTLLAINLLILIYLVRLRLTAHRATRDAPRR